MSLQFSKKAIPVFLICGFLLCCGCTATQQAETKVPGGDTGISSSAVTTPAPSTESEKNPAAGQKPDTQMTNTAFQEQVEFLADELSDGFPITMDMLEQITPELAEQINEDPAAVSLLCLSDLLAPENNEPLRECLNDGQASETPSQKMQTECMLLRYLAETYEASSCEELPDRDDGYQWLANYYWEVTQQCQEYGIDPENSFFLEHPISRQFLIAMLREPVWRMPLLTPLDSDLYDQDSYIDAFNSFYYYLQFGQQSPQLTVEPTPESPETLCTETAVWTMRQAENFVVTLDVDLEDGSTVTLTYTPS